MTTDTNQADGDALNDHLRFARSILSVVSGMLSQGDGQCLAEQEIQDAVIAAYRHLEGAEEAVERIDESRKAVRP